MNEGRMERRNKKRRIQSQFQVGLCKHIYKNKIINYVLQQLETILE